MVLEPCVRRWPTRASLRWGAGLWVLWISVLLGGTGRLAAQSAGPPEVIEFQGRVTVNGVPFTGTGYFAFALAKLVLPDGYWVTYWASRYDLWAGGFPPNGIPISVQNGLYTVRLGDSVAHPGTLPLSTAHPIGEILGISGIRLRVWFSDGVHGFQTLTPEVNLASAPFALLAQKASSVADGAVGLGQLKSEVRSSDATPGTLVERDSGGAFSAAGIRLSGPLSLSDDGVADHGTVTINDQIALRMRGTGNVAVGGAAANGSMSGEFNTAVGGWALDANSTGEYNTAMGLRSLTLNTNGVQNTAVGVDALHSNETGDFNTGVGVQALYYTTGNGNIGIGYRAGFEVTVGDNNILIGSKGSSSDHRVIRIGDPTIHSDTFLSGNIRTDGAAIVGGKISSVGDIQTDGYFRCLFGGAYYRLDKSGTLAEWASSDARLKQDIQTVPDPMETLKRLRGVQYHWNEKGMERHTADVESRWQSLSGTDEDNRALWDQKRREIVERQSKTQTGFIAQEVEEVFPDWVQTGEDGFKKVNMSQLNAVLVEAIKAQQAQIEAQAKACDLLEARLRALEATRP